jgi:Zn-dependent protease with chaperone function
MNGMFEAAMLSGAIIALIAWTATVFFAPSFTVTSTPPGPRTVKARLWLYAPIWVPLAIILASMVPGVFASLFGFGDQCRAHGGHHHHLCVIHPPHGSTNFLPWTIVLGVLFTALTAIGISTKNAMEEWWLSRSLVRASVPSSLGKDIRLLEREEPIALTVGITNPVILLSTGLIQAVSQRTLRIILAHERAHVARRDTTWALLDRLMGSLLPTTVGRELQSALALAREQSCDNAAAQSEGDVYVAAALTEVTRLELSQPAFGLSVGSSSLEARVVHLLERPPIPRWWPAAPLICVVGIVLAGAGPIHNIIERVITLIFH